MSNVTVPIDKWMELQEQNFNIRKELDELKKRKGDCSCCRANEYMHEANERAKRSDERVRELKESFDALQTHINEYESGKEGVIDPYPAIVRYGVEKWAGMLWVAEVEIEKEANNGGKVKQ